jgi:hypothetical protein
MRCRRAKASSPEDSEEEVDRVSDDDEESEGESVGWDGGERMQHYFSFPACLLVF